MGRNQMHATFNQAVIGQLHCIIGPAHMSFRKGGDMRHANRGHRIQQSQKFDAQRHLPVSAFQRQAEIRLRSFSENAGQQFNQPVDKGPCRRRSA